MPCLDCVQCTILTTSLPFPLADIMIYDEESDRHVHIPFEQALFATCYGRRDGTLDTGPRGDLFGLAESFKDPEVIRKFTDSLAARPFDTPVGTVPKAPALSTGIDFISAVLKPSGSDPGMPDNATKMQKIGEQAASGTAGSEYDIMLTILSMVRVGVWLPIEIVIARPFIEHLMLSAVVAVSGRDTGATLFGPAGKRLRATVVLSNSHTHTFTFATDFHALASLCALGHDLQDKDLWSSYLAARGCARNAQQRVRRRCQLADWHLGETHTHATYHMFNGEALTCLCPLLLCLQTCRSRPTRRSRRSKVT